MASKRHVRGKSCERKVRHESYWKALAALKKLTKETGYTGAVYKCAFCGGYHVGRTKGTKYDWIEERGGVRPSIVSL